MTDTSLSDLPAPLLANAERLLLAPADLDFDKVSRVLASIHDHDVDFADFYFQHSRSDGDYARDIIFRDAIEFGVAAFRTNSCAGTVWSSAG